MFGASRELVDQNRRDHRTCHKSQNQTCTTGRLHFCFAFHSIVVVHEEHTEEQNENQECTNGKQTLSSDLIIGNPYPEINDI